MGEIFGLEIYEGKLSQKFSFILQITLKSKGISYSIISLLTTLAALYFSLVMNKFKLDRKVGVSCLIFYLLFIVFAWLIDMNILRLIHPAAVDH